MTIYFDFGMSSLELPGTKKRKKITIRFNLVSYSQQLCLITYGYLHNTKIFFIMFANKDFDFPFSMPGQTIISKVQDEITNSEFSFEHACHCQNPFHFLNNDAKI